MQEIFIHFPFQADWCTSNKTSLHSYPYRPWTSHSDANVPEYGNSTEQRDDKALIYPLPKASLQYIEEKCETELVKLQNYIDSIRELRTYWRNAKDANNSEGFSLTTKNVSGKVSEKSYEVTRNYTEP